MAIYFYLFYTLTCSWLAAEFIYSFSISSWLLLEEELKLQLEDCVSFSDETSLLSRGSSSIHGQSLMVCTTYNEFNYLTFNLRQLKPKPSGNCKQHVCRNCKTSTQLLPTFWHWQFELLASFQRQTKTFWNSKWIRLAIHEFPTRISHFHIEEKRSSNKENAWINAIFHEPQSTSDRFEGNLYDVKVNVLRWRPLSFQYTHTNTHTHTYYSAYSLWRQFVSITQVSAHLSKTFHGFLSARLQSWGNSERG